MSSLRAWLRRNPQPHSVQVVTEDDEIKPIKLSADARNRWKGAEDAINSIPQGRHVQCLDADGVIRWQPGRIALGGTTTSM